jgi:SulP family sulfate permease
MVGPLFFGTVNTFNAEVERFSSGDDVILSLRTVPLLDTTGIGALEDLIGRVEAAGGQVYLSGLNDPVREYLGRAGILAHLGPRRIYWSAYEAIVAADRRRAGMETVETSGVAEVEAHG